jgi:copper homeostasis protein
VLLEVIACSVEDAVEAERGGAGRLEVVREPGRGGLTPDDHLVEEIQNAVRIPLRVMIRESDDYAAGTAEHQSRLARLASRFASLGVDGVVLGFLDGGGIDAAAMGTVLAAAAPLRATFHHAFDELSDPHAALRALARWPQIDRVLTSGGAGDWTMKAARLQCLAGSRISILAGGGVDLQALRALSRTSLTEAHVGRAARVPARVDGIVSSTKVAALVEAARG